MRLSQHLIILTAIAAFSAVFAGQLSLWYSLPRPMRAFKRHRTEFFAFVHNATIEDDSAPHRGLVVPADLASTDVSRIYESGGCIFFSFHSLPPDPLLQLVYCGDEADLYRVIMDRIRARNLLDLRRVDERWYYLKSN